ncbi:MAG: terpene cyclase/mutase family protein [Planctomycetota bacterium]|nr:terpene cyclase/mutase family protein [Planctomycetota bacterium]
MARHARHTHPDAFASEEDFNAQLYGALRQSPWWMVSIALHVFAFVILAMFNTSETVAQETRTITMSPGEPDEAPDEIEKTQEQTKEVNETDLVVKEPLLVDDPVLDKPQTENDLDSADVFGEDEGFSDAHLGGPSKNGTVGIGGDAGGSPFGPGGRLPGGGGGGSPSTFHDALDAALRWLAAHQSPDGGWEAAGFHRWCDGRPVTDPARMPDGLGGANNDPGVTGLALCAFLGAGYTNRGKHPFNKVVSKGLRYLKNIQDPEGCFGPRNSQQYIYNHAIAALAMVEAFGMTGSPIWKGAAQRGLDFIALARNPYFVWRYGVKPGDNDTSVTGWMMMALKSAALINKDAVRRGRKAPLTYDEGSFDGIRAWLDKMTDPDYGRVGYVQRGTGPARPQALIDRFPGDKSESMTAVGVLARVFIGEDPRKSAAVKNGAALCAKLPPTWNTTDGSIDMYYWYYGTLAMFQVGGAPWKTWRTAMDKAMVQSQRQDTDACLYKGSWDPIGPWGADGGRVYSTALMAMCLEVYFRYPKVFGGR